MSDKIQILVVNAPEEINGVTWWRMFRPLRLLSNYADLDIRFNEGRIFEHHLLFADIVLAFRPGNPDHPQVLARAKELGCKIIVDYDDDLLNVPLGYSMYKDTAPKKRFVLESLALADLVWVSTSHLKDVLQKAADGFLAEMRRSLPAVPPLYGKPEMVVIPNAVLPEDLPSAPNGNTKTVVWRGSDFHRDDLELYKSQYEQLLRNSNRFEWVGYMPTWGAVKGSHAKIDYNAGIQADKWFDYLKSIKPSLIWKPLVNNDFNKAKSNIAWLEATVAGGICLSNFAGEAQWEQCTKELPKLDEYYSVQWQKSAIHIRQHYDLRAWNEIRYGELLKLANG